MKIITRKNRITCIVWVFRIFNTKKWFDCFFVLIWLFLLLRIERTNQFNYSNRQISQVHYEVREIINLLVVGLMSSCASSLSTKLSFCSTGIRTWTFCGFTWPFSSFTTSYTSFHIYIYTTKKNKKRIKKITLHFF